MPLVVSSTITLMRRPTLLNHDPAASSRGGVASAGAAGVSFAASPPNNPPRKDIAPLFPHHHSAVFVLGVFAIVGAPAAKLA